jgi:hypothetical protein
MPTRPAILGSLHKGKYINHVIGFELQLDPACTFDDESLAIASSTQFPQRLSLALRCGDNLVLLSSFPLHADEKVDLAEDMSISLKTNWRKRVRVERTGDTRGAARRS